MRLNGWLERGFFAMRGIHGGGRAERWFLAAAKERGVEQFLAFVNSPPGRMTLDGLTNMGSNRTAPSNLKPGYEGQYAKYLADILLHFRDGGAVNDARSRMIQLLLLMGITIVTAVLTLVKIGGRELMPPGAPIGLVPSNEPEGNHSYQSPNSPLS